MKTNRGIVGLLDSTDIIIPTLLGKNFHIANDPDIYQVVGLRWRSQEIVLRQESSEKLRTMVGQDFLRLATQIQE